MELVDQRLGCNYDIEEAEKMVNVALVCTNQVASERPTMSEVVNMLEGTMVIPDEVPDFRAYANDLRFRTIRSNRSDGISNSEISTGVNTETPPSSAYSQNLLPNSGYSAS